MAAILLPTSPTENQNQASLKPAERVIDSVLTLQFGWVFLFHAMVRRTRKTHQSPAVEIVEPLKQLDDRRLAAARVADEGDLLPRGDGHGEVAQDLGLAARGVREGRPRELDVALVLGLKIK